MRNYSPPWICLMTFDGRTVHCRLKGLDYTSGSQIFGEAIWYNVPKTADFTKLDDRARRTHHPHDVVGKVRSLRCIHHWHGDMTHMFAQLPIRYVRRHSTTQMNQDHHFESRHPSRYPPRGEEEPDEKGIAHLPGAHENRSSGKLATSHKRLVSRATAAWRQTRWLQFL